MLSNGAKTIVNRSASIFINLPFIVAIILMVPLAYTTSSLFLSILPVVMFGVWMIPGAFFEFMYIIKRVDSHTSHVS